MRIAYITAGAAGMYCGSCLHDNTLAAALLELGEDVVLVPTYTPLRTDEPDVSIDRVFFGGINVYLQEKVPLVSPHAVVARSAARSSGAARTRCRGRAGSVDPDKARRHDRLDAPRRGRQSAQGSGKARPLAAHRHQAGRRAPLELDATRHGANDPRARRPAGRLPAFGRRPVSRKTAAAALRAGPRSCCANGPPTSMRSSRSIATTPISWPTIWPSIAHGSTSFRTA